MRREFGFESLLPFLQQDPPGSGGTGDDPKPTNDRPSDPKDQPSDPPKPFMTFPDEASWKSRLKRESRSQLDEQAKELGFESHQAMLDAAKAAREQEEQKQSDLDKEKQAREAAERARDEALQRANERLIKAEVVRLCSTDDEAIRKQFDKIVDADVAYALMDHASVEVDDDGNVNGVADALKSLLEKKPFLKVTSTMPDPVPASPKPATGSDRQQLVAAEKDRLLKSGQYGI